MRYFFALILWSMSISYAGAHLSFVFQYQGQDIVLDQDFSIDSSGSAHRIQIQELKFYISQLRYKTSTNGQWIEHPKKYHLLDLRKPETGVLTTTQTPVLIEFTLGVDSLMNEQGVQGGDLDPLHGMYWAWNSGYINFKLEAQTNFLQTRKKMMKWHLGGYLESQQSSFQVRAQVLQGQVILDLTHLLSQELIIKNPQVMAPGPQTQSLLPYLQRVFKSP